MTSRRTLRIAIIGAGFGGLGMAAQLRRAGIDSFAIFEKADSLGGIWRDNIYPGCCCDVPSHLYSYSFLPYRDSACRYPPQQDILDYLHRVAEVYGLGPHLRFSTEVTSARYRQDTAQWEVVTNGSRQHLFDVVIYAVGQLHRPYMPDIPGQHIFAGTAFHSARWDTDHELTGRRVAVIGSGASAVQLIPRLAHHARQLFVFQRTANWVLPKPSAAFSAPMRMILNRVPFAHEIYRKNVELLGDLVLWPAVTRGWSAALLELTARAYLRTQVQNSTLREKLTPDHPLGCKRVLLSNDYYPALTRGNVTLVTDPITELTPVGIRTANNLYAVDTVVYATGFRSTEFLQPSRVVGRNGADLHELWRDGAYAYLGTAVPQFPNLFIIHGPNSFVGHNSNILMKECQIRYIMACLRRLASYPAGSLEVRSEAMDHHRRTVQDAVDATVWDRCSSWYQTPQGAVTNPWPGPARHYRRLLRQPRFEDFQLV